MDKGEGGSGRMDVHFLDFFNGFSKTFQNRIVTKITNNTFQICVTNTFEKSSRAGVIYGQPEECKCGETSNV